MHLELRAWWYGLYLVILSDLSFALPFPESALLSALAAEVTVDTAVAYLARLPVLLRKNKSLDRVLVAVFLLPKMTLGCGKHFRMDSRI